MKRPERVSRPWGPSGPLCCGLLSPFHFLAGSLGAAAICIGTILSPAGAAGVVHTRAGALAGEAAFVDGGVRVGGKTVPAADVLLVHTGRSGRTVRQPNVVHWASGEVWRCEVLGLAGGTLKVRSPLWGTKDVSAAGAGAMGFAPGGAPGWGHADPPPYSQAKANTLYRKQAEPLPGALLWISPREVAVDSPLGALALEREGLTWLVFGGWREPNALAGRPGPAVPTGQAEVVLLDGSVLRGELTLTPRSPAGAGLTLRHASLGELAISPARVRSVLFGSPSVAWLTDLPLSARDAGLVGRGDPQDAAEVASPGAPGGTEAEFARSIRIDAGCEVSCRLPGDGAVLRLTPVAGDGARGEAVLRVSAGGKDSTGKKVLWEKVIAPDSAHGGEVAVDLGGARELTFSVSFSQRLRLPCAAVLGDPYVISR